jgi:serine protease
MTLPSTLRQLAVLVGAAFALASAPSPASAASRSVNAASPVYGLIVQLRDAPSHVELAREQALARGGPVLAREKARWQRLMVDLRADDGVLRELPHWAKEAPQRDPVGASAQVLRFAKPLTAEQAERVAARLAARPDVAWVEPNIREQRQATAANAPNDQFFAGTNGQWWLQAVGQGGNGSPIAQRLRGVPNFLPAWLNGSNGSAAAVVAVLDSGITCHPDLGNNTPNCIGGAILPGYDFVADWDPVANRGYANDGDGRDADPRDPGDWVDQADRNADPVRYGSCAVESSSWHGTVIAGIVAAQTNNGAGVAGINWYGRILPVRVAGKCGADVADIVEGMRWAAGLSACKRSDGAGGCAEFAPANPNPARIINISFGGSATCGKAYQDAINAVRAAPGGGAVVVAAAGNGWGAPSRPASCQGVIGVAALNRDGFKTTYSNFGPALAIATVGGDDDDGAWGSALGVNSVADSGLLTLGNSAPTTPANCTLPGANCYFYDFGTSFSTPLVSGAVSLMLSVNPVLSVDQMISGLRTSARAHVTSSIGGFSQCSDANPGRCLCTTSTCGAGILDAAQALLYAASPATYVPPITHTQGAVLDTPELRAAVLSGPDRPANAPPPAPSGGGGGAMSAGWLLALALATLALLYGRFNATARRGPLRQCSSTERSRHPARRRHRR